MNIGAGIMKTQVSGQTSRLLPAGAALSAALFIGLLTVSLPATSALAQGSAGQAVSAQTPSQLETRQRRVAPRTLHASRPVSAKPTWKELTPAQQQALQPLAQQWSRLSEEHKRKWLVISRDFQSLPPVERAKLHSRMSEWASLSARQREQARLNYTGVKTLSAEEKAAQWQAYQALSPEEKRKLAAKAPASPAGVAVIKTAPSSKVANVPVTKRHSTQGAKLAAAKQPVQQHTLLPQPEVLATESGASEEQ